MEFDVGAVIVASSGYEHTEVVTAALQGNRADSVRVVFVGKGNFSAVPARFRHMHREMRSTIIPLQNVGLIARIREARNKLVVSSGPHAVFYEEQHPCELFRALLDDGFPSPPKHNGPPLYVG